ncbi:hypothetical protein Cgig2_008363 [Carnegiea gigantea]|uniref:Uncharacterized protein n=1 Tax=Carnegiea gigantea TaxID=171969 RepID=A0A9Q1QGV7_9CARY|nr:hypothetical protein Cgig2_008363 [Carnegiea gigantea]
MGAGNTKHEMLKKSKIRQRKAVWLVQNFDACFCSFPIAHGRMRVTEHDVHMTLGLLKGPLEVVIPKDKSNASVKFVSLLNLWKQEWPEHDSIPKCGHSQVDGGMDFKRHCVTLVVSTSVHGKQRVEVNYLMLNTPIELSKATLDKNTIIDEEEEVNKGECHNKSVTGEAKVEDQTRVLKDDKVVTNLIITNSRLLLKLMTESEELLPSTITPLKRVRKDTPKKSKNRTLVLSQDSPKSERVLIESDMIEKILWAPKIRG